MKIQYISDLHLEFEPNEKFVRKVMTPVECDILVIAGDLHHLTIYKKINWFLDWLNSKYPQVFIIPGNHDYYCRYDMSRSEDHLFEALRERVFLVNNHLEKIDGKQLIFSTLWSNIFPHAAKDIRRGMRDFYKCEYGRDRLTISQYIMLHKKSVSFLQNQLNNSDLPTAIFTHHAPTWKVQDPIYTGSVLNSAFYSELDYLMEVNPQLKYWVYGHTHSSIETKIGQCQVISNQLGYVHIGEEKDFNWNRFFEI